MKTSLIVLCLVLMAACGPTQTAAPAATRAPATAGSTLEVTAPANPTEPLTPTDTPELTPATSLTVKPSACVPHNKQVKARVTRVIDGDTVQVKIGSKYYKVRYIGMDTPEINPQVERYGKEASAKNKALVGGKTVTLIQDVSEVDQYGRLLRYVFVGDTFVNYELVYEGYASQATFPPDVACAETFARAEESARENKKGLWGP